MRALITRGCITNHGGIIQAADNSFVIEEIPVHLEDMSHCCPKCKAMSRAIPREKGFLMVQGGNIMAVNDMITSGAKFIRSNQQLVVRETGFTIKNSSSPTTINPFINAPTAKIFVLKECFILLKQNMAKPIKERLA